MNTQVAIIGAGPAGLLLGQLLSKLASIRLLSNVNQENMC
jgi:2-polyprenyl-6-methoxyphenol hydroxylase-like FAD-dependent oxidoreductase